MTKKYRSWLAEWLWEHKNEPAGFRTLKAERLPKSLEPNIIYQIGDADCVWSAAMNCPCGCGAIIQLSLVQDARPSWRIQKRKNGEITLFPSVWRTAGCRSHFIIYRSRLIWCSNDTPEPDSWW